MKWTYSIKNKLMASAALLTLSVLVLFSNYIDRNHTNNVKQSIGTLYEDRLIVEDYILKMTIDAYEIKQALFEADKTGVHPERINTLLSHIEGLSLAYRKTKFTTTEDATFTALVKVLDEFNASSTQSIAQKLAITNRALALLNQLSSIQLEESKLIMKQAEDLYVTGRTLSQFAFGITLVILLVLQALVFASRTLTGKEQTPSSLN